MNNAPRRAAPAESSTRNKSSSLFASLKGASRLVGALGILCAGCITQPLPEAPGALEKTAAVDTILPAPNILPPIEPWIPIQE